MKQNKNTPTPIQDEGYTPGPWIQKRLDENHSTIYGGTGLMIVPRMITEKGKQSDEDAKLIASAPQLKSENEQLREALKQFIHSVEHEGVIQGRVTDAVRNAKSAIQKHSNK